MRHHLIILTGLSIFWTIFWILKQNIDNLQLFSRCKKSCYLVRWLLLRKPIMLNNGSIVGALFPLLIRSTRQISMLSHSTEQEKLSYTCIEKYKHFGRKQSHKWLETWSAERMSHIWTRKRKMHNSQYHRTAKFHQLRLINEQIRQQIIYTLQNITF